MFSIFKLQLIFPIFLFSSVVSASVQIFPTRLTLSEKTLSGHLTLRNSSESDQEYELGLVLYKMRSDGGFDRQKVIPANHPLLDKLKFSPFKVALKPSEKQVVRVMVAEFGDLSNGESYLHLEAVPQAEVRDRSRSKSNLQINARIAVAVPIIVRKGEVDTVPEIVDAKYQRLSDGGLLFEFELLKKGSGSVFGDLEIFENRSESPVVLTTVKGISSYIDKRSVKVTLSADEIKDLMSKKEVKFSYRFSSNEESASSFLLSGDFELKTQSKSRSKSRQNQ